MGICVFEPGFRQRRISLWLTIPGTPTLVDLNRQIGDFLVE